MEGRAASLSALMQRLAAAKRTGPAAPLFLKVVSLFDTPVGRNVTTMIASAGNESELSRAFRNHFVVVRREEGRALLLQVIDRGEIRN